MKRIGMKTVLLVALSVFGSAICSVRAATDYFAVAAKGSSDNKCYVHIFAYDTVAASVTFQKTITNSGVYANYDVGISATTNYGFIIGHRSPPNVDRYVTTDKTNWTRDLSIDLERTTAGAFLDSGYRSSANVSYYHGVAMLKDGKVFISSGAGQTGSVRYYGLGDVSGLSGAVTSIFARDTDHLGNLADGYGVDALRDVTSTIEGTANRFVTCVMGGGATTVMVYNADGTYKGAVTPVGSYKRALGVFKSTNKGDLIIQADMNSGVNSTVSVRGIYVDDSRFNTAAFNFTDAPPAARGFLYTDGIDVDGLESGRIVVIGKVRQVSGDVRKTGIQIYESNDGTTWNKVFTLPLWLMEAAGSPPADITGATIAGLYYTAPASAFAPVIVSVGASNVTSSAADLVGNLTAGTMPVTVTCYWGTNDGANVAANWMTNDVVATSALGYLTNQVSNLTPGKLYYFRYFASNATDTAWGVSTKSFTTPGAPTVDNANGATSVGQTSAQFNGNVRGGYPDPHVWIYWGTTNGGTDKNAWDLPVLDLGTRSLGAFVTNQTSLLVEQTYWYRCYASNDTDGVWAPASTNFTTALPVLSISNAGVEEGAQGATTTMVFSVTLSAAHTQEVGVHYQTAGVTATTNDNDYVAIPDTLLTLPAGMVSTQIVVTVNGDHKIENTETFVVNLSNVTHATLASAQAVGTITNDDTILHVRGDGQGSDANSGATWLDALATLTNAMAQLPAASGTMAQSTPFRIHVQSSAAGTAYDVAAKAVSSALDLDFQGGWENVNDALPTQTGISVVKDLNGPVDKAGIKLTDASGGGWRRVVVNRFAFTNVTRGIEIATWWGYDGADILLTVSNTTVYAQKEGIYLDYPRNYAGPVTKVTAVNVEIVAGLDGGGGAANHGIYVVGSWNGSAITASGNDAAGVPRVSTIRSASGCGVYFTAPWHAAHRALFSNTAIYGCSSNAIHLDAAKPYLVTGDVTVYGSNIVRAVLANCTVADNTGDGLYAVSATAGSYVNVTNCIFAGNGGHGVNLDSPNGAFTCAEGYNVFFDDDVLTNGTVKTLVVPTATTDPLFYAHGAKPSPWYLLCSASSPAYHKASDNIHNRGAYQADHIPGGTIVFFR